jgi:hypothetical protein
VALDPNIDPMLAAQLYGAPDPSLAPVDPWSWVPPHWNEAPVEQLPPQTPVTVAPPDEFPPLPDAGLAAPVPPPVEPGPPEQLAPPLPVATLGNAIGPPPVAELPTQLGPPPTALLGAPPPITELPSVRDARAQEVLNQRALHDRAGFAEDVVRDREDRNAYIARRRKEMADDDISAARQNAEDLRAASAATQQKMDVVMADAQRIAATRIDPTGGLTGGRRIAGVISAIIGGLVQGRTGSARNAGLDALVDTINRGIDAQKADLANQREGVNLRRSVLAQEFARHGDMYRAVETVRLAALQHADDLLATEQQKYNSQGRTGLLIAGERAEAAGEQAASIEALRLRTNEEARKEREQLRKEVDTAANIANQRATIGLGYARINEDREQRKEARAARAEDKALERADKEAERRRQFAIGGIPKVRVGADGKPVMGPDGKPAIDYDVLRNNDGSVWEAESSEATRELRTKKTTSTEVVAIIDEIRAIRGRVGGESKLLNSKDAQRLGVLKARAQLLTKQGTQGMSSDKDMDTIEDAAGTTDAASWRDQEGKLEEARARSISALNQALRDAKYSGPAIDFPESRPTESTLDEIKFEGLLTKPDESLDQARQRIDEARAGGFDVGYNPDASIKQQVGIARLGQEATGPADDQGAALARTRLQKIAAEAPTSALRQLARATLESALRSGLGSAEETTTASGARGPQGEQSSATAVPDELRAR